MTWKITVQAVTYHTYFLEDDDRDGDDYTWAIKHTGSKLTEAFAWKVPGDAQLDFPVNVSSVSRRHGQHVENEQGYMTWEEDPTSEELGHELPE